MLNYQEFRTFVNEGKFSAVTEGKTADYQIFVVNSDSLDLSESEDYASLEDIPDEVFKSLAENIYSLKEFQECWNNDNTMCPAPDYSYIRIFSHGRPVYRSDESFRIYAIPDSVDGNDDLLDNDFMDIAEEEGTVWSLFGFQENWNNDNMMPDPEGSYLRIIPKEIYSAKQESAKVRRTNGRLIKESKEPQRLDNEESDYLDEEIDALPENDLTKVYAAYFITTGEYSTSEEKRIASAKKKEFQELFKTRTSNDIDSKMRTKLVSFLKDKLHHDGKAFAELLYDNTDIAPYKSDSDDE